MRGEDTDFIYSVIGIGDGITVEIVEGGKSRSKRVRELLAQQVWAEHAAEGGYRTLEHTESGAPLLLTDSSEPSWNRISITHTEGLWASAILEAAMPDSLDPETFTPQAAIGIDAERATREQAANVRERFLSTAELELTKGGNTATYVLAWTCKEAMLKLGMNPAVDIRTDLIIKSLPHPGKLEGSGALLRDGEELPVVLRSIRFNGFIITVATLASC